MGRTGGGGTSEPKMLLIISKSEDVHTIRKLGGAKRVSFASLKGMLRSASRRPD